MLSLFPHRGCLPGCVLAHSRDAAAALRLESPTATIFSVDIASAAAAAAVTVWQLRVPRRHAAEYLRQCLWCLSPDSPPDDVAKPSTRLLVALLRKLKQLILIHWDTDANPWFKR